MDRKSLYPKHFDGQVEPTRKFNVETATGYRRQHSLSDLLPGDMCGPCSREMSPGRHNMVPGEEGLCSRQAPGLTGLAHGSHRGSPGEGTTVMPVSWILTGAHMFIPQPSQPCSLPAGGAARHSGQPLVPMGWDILSRGSAPPPCNPHLLLL